MEEIGKAVGAEALKPLKGEAMEKGLTLFCALACESWGCWPSVRLSYSVKLGLP